MRLIRWVVDRPGLFKHSYEENMKRNISTLLVLLAAATNPLLSQDNFFEKWEARTSTTQAKQPSWPPPLISPYPMLIQTLPRGLYASDYSNPYLNLELWSKSRAQPCPRTQQRIRFLLPTLFSAQHA